MDRPSLKSAALFCLALAALSFAKVPRSQAQDGIDHRQSHFACGGKKIRLEIFLPSGVKTAPALILVPESKGMADVGPIYRAIAARFGEEGFAVVLVHFFDRTGHTAGVDPKAIQKQDFLDWADTVSQCVHHVRGLPGIQKDNIGMVGFSLGAFLALTAASEEKLDVKAVASYFGGIPDELWPQVTHLPPTLIVHGVKDDIVHVRNAYAVIGFCAANKVPHRSKIYPEGHLFEKTLTAHLLRIQLERFLGLRTGEIQLKDTIAEVLRDNAILRDAAQLTMGFFKAHLTDSAK